MKPKLYVFLTPLPVFHPHSITFPYYGYRRRNWAIFAYDFFYAVIFIVVEEQYYILLQFLNFNDVPTSLCTPINSINVSTDNLIFTLSVLKID